MPRNKKGRHKGSTCMDADSGYPDHDCEDGGDMPEEPPVEANNVDFLVVLNAINGTIQTVNDNISDMKNNISDIKEDQKRDFELLNSSLTNIQDQMAALKSNASVLTTRVDIIEKQCNDCHASLTNKITELESSLDSLGTNASKMANQLICKGIPKSESHSEENLKQYVHYMFYENLKLDINTVKVTDIEQIMLPDGNKGPITITMDSPISQKMVLTSKNKLKDIDKYEKVFIERKLTKQELKLDRTMRIISKTVPGLKYVGGRLVSSILNSSVRD